MKSLGISISRERLSAVLWERSYFASRIVHRCSVPCAEPFGGPEDAARLASEIRNGAGGGVIAPAVLSLPPSWTYVRPVELPVADLARAKKIHLAELEGNLPIEDDEILSDLLPSPAGRNGHFLAVAARRPAVENTVASYAGAGFRVDRVITDHVSLLHALLASTHEPAGYVFSFLSDILVLRLEGGALSSARQFPAALKDAPDELAQACRDVASGDAEAVSLPPVTVFGEAPAALSAELPHAVRFRPPTELADTELLAFGAALAPFYSQATGRFSLRTSAESESQDLKERRRVRTAAIAGAVAVGIAIGAVPFAAWVEAKKVARVRAQIRQEFSEAAPDVKVIVQEAAQIKSRVESLKRQQKELGTYFPSPTTLLAKVSQALPAKENISLRDVSLDAGKLRLAGEADSARLVEAYRTALSGAFGPGSNVSIQESQGSERGGAVRFTLVVEERSEVRASKP